MSESVWESEESRGTGSASLSVDAGPPAPGHSDRGNKTRRPLQFRLSDLLILVTAICLVLAASAQWGLLGGYIVMSACLVLGVVRNVRPRSKQFTYGVRSAGVLFVLFLIFIMPALQEPRTPSRRNACLSNIRQIGLALAYYEMQFGCYPPAYTVNAQGHRLHSWRTAILPFMERGALYDRLDLNLPWDDPSNASLLQYCFEYHLCPLDRNSGANGCTAYVAVVGPETMWPGSQPRKLSEVTDGPGNTILLVEIAHSTINWPEPLDLTLEQVIAGYRRGDLSGVGSRHNGGGFHALFADGSVRYIDPSKINEPTLRAMFTVAGND